MNALRLVDGVPAQLFCRRTGLPATDIAAALQQLRDQGLLRCNGARLQTTARGFRFLDSVLQAFMPDTPAE